MAQPGKISLSDYATRHPERAIGDPNQPEPEPCPVCGYPNCIDPAEHAAQLALGSGKKKPPAAPRERREEPPLRVEPDVSRDPERLVVAKQDFYEEVVPPNCIDSVSILRVGKGQRLPMSEAVAFGIEWQEQDGPDTFQVAIKDGTPMVLDRGGMVWDDDAGSTRVLRGKYQGDVDE